VPSFSGRYSIEIFLDDNPIGGSPILFVALDVPEPVATAAPRRAEMARASTSTKGQEPGGQLNMSKSKELEEVKSQKESAKTRKERPPTGSQTHREVASAEKPRKAKRTAEKASPSTKKKNTGKKSSTVSASTTTRKKAPSTKTKKPVQPEPEPEEGSDEQREREDDED